MNITGRATSVNSEINLEVPVDLFFSGQTSVFGKKSWQNAPSF